jgi:hypothetical protein
MRFIPLAGVIALALALGGSVSADPVPYSAAVTAPEAEVRCGASLDPQFYTTNRLRKGDIVQVLKERGDGWLEIQPPAGSFSWINARFLMQTQPNSFVVTAPAGSRVQVLVGAEVGQGKPTVAGSALEQGTLVHRYQKGGQPGAPLIDRDETWMPIEPPPSEVRYLRAEAVAKASGAAPAPSPIPARPQPIGNPAANTLSASFVPTQASAAAAAASDKPTHAEVDELYQKAVDAERAGNTQLAIYLYTKVGAMGLPINHTYAPLAIARANKLLNETPSAAPPVTDSRLRPVAADPAPPPTVRLARPSSPNLTIPDQTVTTTGAIFTTSRQGGDQCSAFQWVGRLRRAGRGIGDRPTYVLESASGSPLLYANGVPGLNLESYVGQYVELLGSASYYGQIRANYMSVTQVRPAQ